MKKLLVIIPDYLSALIKKGEITERYYNPGNLFDEVHIIMTNDDRPDPSIVQPMVGSAKLFFHNYPEPERFFKKTLGWQPFLMKNWVDEAVKYVDKIRPNLIRCHGAHLNTYLAAIIKKKLAIPYVVSLHINPDVNVRGNASDFKDKFIGLMLKKIEKIGLKSADLVMPVYKPIVPFLKRLQIKNYKVCYNVLNDKKLTQKIDYTLHSPIKVLSVGRQIAEKNPENLIKSLKNIPNIELTLIGQGEYNNHLMKLVHKENLADKVKFVPSVTNDELCNLYHEYDLMALHTEYFELSKVMIESFLVGLPLLVNYRIGVQVPELHDGICLRVENSEEGYLSGLQKLITDHSFRKKIGESAYHHAQELWNPVKCEQKYVDIYKNHMLP